jgi:hypothetical protein
MYTPDLPTFRDHLLASGIEAPPLTYPEYMPSGTVEITDPGGRRGMEPLVELHHARPHAVARPRARSRELPGTPRNGPCPQPGNVEGMWPAGTEGSAFF